MSTAGDLNGDGRPDVWVDKNGDGIPDAIDFDGNGFTDGALIDLNNDGIPDAIDIDNDGSSELWFLTVTASSRSESSIPIASSSDITQIVSRPASDTTQTSSSSSTLARATTSTRETAIVAETSLPSNTSVSPAETQSPPPSDSSTSPGSSGPPIGAIVGGVVGGLVAIAAILCFLWLIIRERRKKAKRKSSNTVETPDNGEFKGEVGGISVSQLGGIEDGARKKKSGYAGL